MEFGIPVRGRTAVGSSTAARLIQFRKYGLYVLHQLIVSRFNSIVVVAFQLFLRRVDCRLQGSMDFVRDGKLTGRAGDGSILLA